MTQAIRNSELAVNQTQVAEGALAQTHTLLDRLRELSLQASDGGLTDDNRVSIQAEFSQMTAEMDRLAQSSGSGYESFQIGPDAAEGSRVAIEISGLQAAGPELNLSSDSVRSREGAQQALSAIDNAIAQISVQRSDIGVLQNRLDFAIRSNEHALENAQASESTLRDADVAMEASRMVGDRIRTTASIAVLAQQNVNRQQAMNLLG